MAISTQAKNLKSALKAINIKYRGDNPSVRTERIYCGKYNGKSDYEKGDAVAIVDILSDSDIEKIKELLPHCKIQNHPKLGFSSVRN
jgi:predicted transcriptional regulator with HTH domain